MIVLLVDAAGFAAFALHFVDSEERVGDTAHRLAAAALLLQDVRRLLQAGDTIPKEQ